MPYVQARCTVCGGLLAADDETVACRCPLCGDTFMVEKGIEYFAETVDFINGQVSVMNSYVSDGDFDIVRGILMRYKGEASDVIVPDGVRVIGSDESNGFYDNKSITSVLLPEGVVRISGYAFHGCSCMTSADIPSSVREIREGAFYGCSCLESSVIPDGIREIMERTFYGCSALTSVRIPSGVREIGSYAFKECTSLREIMLPEGLERIGLYAFEKCRNLKRVFFPESLREICRGAFSGCESLEEVSIGDNTIAAPDSFAGCRRLARIDYKYLGERPEAFPDHKEITEYRKRKKPGR